MKFFRWLFPPKDRKVTVRINVTYDDIRNGNPDDGRECPVALAVKRAIRCDHVCVTPDYLFFRQDGCNVRILLPAEVKVFVDRYDWGDIVSTFPFDITYWLRQD